MKIAVDRRAPEIRFGNERYHLIPVDKITHDFLCEPPYEIAFPDIAALPGRALPERICIGTTHLGNDEYTHICQVDATHYDDRLRIIVHAGYHLETWYEAIDLRFFYPRFVRLLRQSTRVEPINGLALDKNGVAYLEVGAEFPSSHRLVSCQRKIVSELRSKHVEALGKSLRDAVKCDRNRWSESRAG